MSTGECRRRSSEMTRPAVAAVVALTLAALSCGGSAPTPTGSIALQPTSIVVGGSANLNWSSTNAVGCVASGAWSGSQATSGTVKVTPAAAGDSVYALTCRAQADATASASATLSVSAPAPTVTISFNPAEVPPGNSSTLSWSASNASTCSASGSWSGAQAISGSLSVKPLTIGDHLYSLSCTGAGGSASASASLLVTRVRASSYQNKNEVGSAPVTLPESLNAFALADFFQDGTSSLVTHTLEYNPADSSTYGVHGHIHFYKSSMGAWVDQTSVLLSDTTGCIHPRKAVVADFNRDGKPDVYFACHGVDAAPF